MYADVDSAMCWVDWEVSCAAGVRDSYFGRADCAVWVNKYVGGYFRGKCGDVYEGSRGQQVAKGAGY